MTTSVFWRGSDAHLTVLAVWIGSAVRLGWSRSATEAPTRLVDFDFLTFLLRDGIGWLRQRNPENAVLEVGGDLIRIDLVGYCYGPLESAERALRAMNDMAF